MCTLYEMTFMLKKSYSSTSDATIALVPTHLLVIVIVTIALALALALDFDEQNITQHKKLVS